MADRKAHWQQIYAERSPLEVSWYQREPALSLELIEATGIPQTARIIDVGGGASVLVDRLIARGYAHVAVLDIALKALTYAQARLGPQSNQVEWIEADATTFHPPHPFELWHDRAVFHFMTEPADRARYVETLTRTLAPHSHAIIATFGVGGPTRCSGLDIVQYDVDRLNAALGPEFALLETRSEIHVTPANAEQLFTFFRLQRVNVPT